MNFRGLKSYNFINIGPSNGKFDGLCGDEEAGWAESGGWEW